MDLEQLHELITSAASVECMRNLDFGTFLACLRSPKALALSFRRGGSGTPDFAAVSTAVATLVSCKITDDLSLPAKRAAEIMDALSTAFASARVPGQMRQVISHAMDESMEQLDAAEQHQGLQNEHRAPPEVDQGSADMATESDAATDTPRAESFHHEAGTELSLPWQWVLVALAAALPLLEEALPKDEHGVCVLPHQHEMDKQDSEELGLHVTFWGTSLIYYTNKVCDRCMEPIRDRIFYHCGNNCDVDFCARCHEELQGVLGRFFAGGSSKIAGISMTQMTNKMLWAVHAIDELACQILNRSAEERKLIANLLAQEWPIELFSRLVSVVVNTCNAKILYNATQGALVTSVSAAVGMDGTMQYAQEVKPLYMDHMFWYSVGLLQVLYTCNWLQQGSMLLDEPGTRKPGRISCQEFILEGINRCKYDVEWIQWLNHPSTQVPNLITVPTFQITAGFRSLVVHNNLLPISFRRLCLIFDIRERMSRNRVLGRRMAPLVLQVHREPSLLIEDVITAFAIGRRGRTPPRKLSGSASQPDQIREQAAVPDRELVELRVAQVAQVTDGDDSDADGGHVPEGERLSATSEAATSEAAEAEPAPLRRPLRVMFLGEAGQGPGVRKEFFQVALKAFVAALLVPGSNRTYWFGSVDRADAFFACGALLGQAVLNDVLVPSIFPSTLFELLLHDMGSPHASNLTLEHLAAASPEEANSLRHILDYEGSDIGDVYGCLGWERTGRLLGKEITQDNKAEFVDAYVQWALTDRILHQFRHLSDGFRAVLGDSIMLEQMVDALHLEQIVSGGEVPVDVRALQKRCTLQGWEDSENEYIAWLWDVLFEFTEAEKMQFIVFLTGSDRVPLQGWEGLRVVVQKNGSGDDRLPAAYTCFALLLIPKYSSKDVVRSNLLSAIMNSEGFGLN